MNALAEIRTRFAVVLRGLTDAPEESLGLIRPSQDSKFGDYQANFPMALGKKLGRNPAELARELVGRADFSGLCSKVEVAGPGFINLTIDDQWICDQLNAALPDPRLGVTPVANPATWVVDFSSPNVAKPMHVGHIRSTVIGDALSRIIRFVGHQVVTDNHLGDWGTQFGMIIYGYRHFRDEQAWQASPVRHLSELYRKVRGLIDYHDAVAQLPKLDEQVANAEADLKRMLNQTIAADAKAAKEHQKKCDRQQARVGELRQERESVARKIAAVQNDPERFALASQHQGIGVAVLEETAALHAGNEESLRLWNDFLPHCLDDIERIYQRLNVTFDHQLGESFYHDQLAVVVEELEKKGLIRESDGATCVFPAGFETPMIVRKRDGAFLYATTDLATIRYRMQIWNPSAILYVVDHRQHEHFEKLFAVAKDWGFDRVQLVHVSFGTVLGDDGRPFKTRAGDAVGLDGLLDEAEERAAAVLREMQSPHLAGLSAEELSGIARAVGIGGLKYADLSQNRASDYKFSYDKMLELKGNTATYLQYLYARVQGVFREGDVTGESVRSSAPAFVLATDVERQLGIRLLRFQEVLDEVLVDFRPNLLAQYMFELAQLFFRFYDQCRVLKAETAGLRSSRLALCDLTARTVGVGLDLLGIQVVDRM